MSVHPRMLGMGRTSGGVELPVEVGGTGQLDGSGEPVVEEDTGTMPLRLLYGRTAGGVNKPLRVDNAGKLNITWS